MPIEPPSADKPYRGPASYQSEDAHLFFGRDACSEQVIAKLLSSRFMLLHAQSGAGKTSLLNARVLPELEARGWLAVRVTPQNDPVGEVRLATFLQLLPSPRAEAAAIDRAILALAEPDEHPTINQLVDRYDSLTLRDERRRRLVAPVALGTDDAAALNISRGETLPFFCRLLRSSIDIAGFDAHLAALSGDTFLPAGDLRASDLVVALSGVALIDSYKALVVSLSAAPEDMVSFFKTWLQIWGSRHPRYSIVLILDQFEQMFTLFSDRRRKGRAKGEQARDWSVRDAFFKELRELYEYRYDAVTGSEGEHALPAALPMRYSISLRDEFVARLDPVRCFVPDLDTTAYHLPLLTSSDAKTAIEQPASQYGYTYEENCIDDILQKLLKEGRFIEPAHLQIVCDKLWEVRVEKLAKAEASGGADSKDLHQVDFETYQGLGYAEGILRNFISGFIERLDPEAQLDALELLEPLITSSGTRNIAEWSQLIYRPLRDPVKREALVLEMQSRNIVRVEWRLGGRFVEITHEFLIEPILHAIRSKLYGDSETARFVEARRLLERIAAAPNRTDERMLLSPREFDILEQHATRVVWSRASAEAMLRSAVVNARESDEIAAPRIRAWADRYRGDIYESVAYRTGPGGTLDPEPQPDPTIVIAEYLASPSPKVRESAICALGLFGEQSAIVRLVDLALTRKEEAPASKGRRVVDFVLRALKSDQALKAARLVDRPLSGGEDARAAADELLRLDGAPQRHAITRLLEAIDVTGRRFWAYTLLGKMHGKGAEVVLPPRPLRSRLQTARIRVGPTFGVGEWRRRWQLLEPGMVGGGIGVVLVALMLEAAFSRSGISPLNAAMSPLSFGLFLGAPLLVLAAVSRSDPIHLHVDQGATAFVEVARAWLAPLFPWPVGVLLAAVLVIVFVPQTPSEISKDDQIWIATTLIIALATAAVRAGTLLAYETFSDNADANRFWQWAGGVALGLPVVLLGTAWMISFVSDEGSRAGVLKIGLFLLPTCFALPLAYARSETATPPRRPVLGRYSRYIVGLGLAVTFGILVFAIMRSSLISTRTRVAPGTVALSSPAPSHAWPIDYLPTRVAFSVPRNASDSAIPGRPSADSAGTVMGAAFGGYQSADSLGVRLFDSAGKKELDYSAHPPRFDVPLRHGRYVVEIAPTDTAQFGAELIHRARQSLGFEKPPSPKYAFTVRVPTPALDTLRADAHRASLVAAKVYRLTRGRSPDWVRAQAAADTSIRLLGLALRQDSLFSTNAVDLNRVCWWGTLAGRAAKVMSICELGVALAPNDEMVRDSRGLARALLHDPQGAISDFTFFERAMRASDDTLHQRWGRVRTGWIDRLRRGEELDLRQVREETR